MSLNSVQIGNDNRFVTTPSGHVVRPDSAVTLRQRSHVTYVLPRNSVQAATLQSGTTDVIFDIPSNQLDYLDLMYLKYTLTNNHGASALTLIDAFTMIEYVTISANNEDIQYLYGYAIRNNILATQSAEEFNQVAAGVGISPTTYASTINLAAGASQTFYVPIHTVIDRSKIPLWRHELQFRVTVRWLTGSQILMTGSAAAVTDCTISNVALFLDGELMDPSVRALDDAVLVSSPKSFRYLEHRRDQLSFGSITNGTITQQNYTGSGYCAYCWIWLGASNAANESLYNSLALTTFEIIDNGLQTFHNLGDNQFTSAFMRVLSSNQWKNSHPFGLLNMYYVSWSDDPAEALANGSNYGSYRIKGNSEALRITPGVTNASAKVYIYGMFYSTLHVDFAAGRMKVERSTFA